MVTPKELQFGSLENFQFMMTPRGHEYYTDLNGLVGEVNSELKKEWIIEVLDASDDPILFSDRLGIAYEDLKRLTSQRKVVSFRVGDESYYPRWQLNDKQILPGVDEVFKLFRGDAIVLTKWINSTR